MTEDPKEILTIISSFPITTLGVNTININYLDQYLQSKNISQKELDQFYFSFLKSRHTHLKNPDKASIICDFLMERYNGDKKKLEPYFSFFPFLRSNFEDIDIDFKEKSPEHISYLRVNLRRTIESLCINKMKPNNLEFELSTLLRCIKDFNPNISEFCCEKIGSNMEYVLEFRLYTKNELPKKYLEEEIHNFLFFRKKNPTIKIDEENIYIYLQQRHLNCTVNNSNNKKKIKM